MKKSMDESRLLLATVVTHMESTSLSSHFQI